MAKRIRAHGGVQRRKHVLHSPMSVSRATISWIGLFVGPALGLLVLVLVPNAEFRFAEDGDIIRFGFAGRAVLGLLAWMGVWWMSEAVDVAVTALLPLALLPLITVAELGSAKTAMAEAASPYANENIFLFMGGFLLALSMERWGLHRRIALTALRFGGTGPRGIIAAFMAIAAVMSMWVSNSATAVMMVPIAISVATLAGTKKDDPFAVCLMLGIAYAASVGGIGTIIGTPPNTLLVGYLRDNLGIQISFARWMMIGLPLVAVFVPLIWLYLTGIAFPVGKEPLAGGAELIRSELEALGPMKRGELVTLVVFLITALTWIFRPLLIQIEIGGVRPLGGLTDASIAMAGALLLFVVPASAKERVFVMDWETTQRLPWGILILFGGGLSLASAMQRHGAAEFIGYQASGLGGLPTVLVIVCIVAAVIFLTEFTSNTATTATLLPILGGLAPSLGIDPLMLAVPAAIAASCAFMMPVATPPNAIVFGSGRVTIPQMAKAGFWINLMGIVLVTVLAYALVVPLLIT